MANGSGSETHGPRRKSVASAGRGGSGATGGSFAGSLGPDRSPGEPGDGSGAPGGGGDRGAAERAAADRPAGTEEGNRFTTVGDEGEPSPSGRARVSVSPRAGTRRTKTTQRVKRDYQGLTVEGGTKVAVGTFALLSGVLGPNWNLSAEEAELVGESFVDMLEPYPALADFVARYASPLLFGGVMTNIVGKRMKGQGPRLQVVPPPRSPARGATGGAEWVASPPPPPPTPPPPPPPPTFRPETVESEVPNIFGA